MGRILVSRGEDDSWVTIRLAGSFDASGSAEMHRHIAAVAAELGRPLVIDLTAADFVHISMLGVLADAWKRHAITIAATPGTRVWRRFETTNLLGRLSVHATAEEASTAILDAEAPERTAVA